ncbi:MAG: hypothetical protein DMG77_08100 [Acidobacteria bacterium]|nr:MAG: hypothetical protein DMG77_08100 [Acidobacteriota bacterium]
MILQEVRESPLLKSLRGVILTAAAFQAEGRISRAYRRGVRLSSQARSLTRLNCADFRDDASEKGQGSKLHHDPSLAEC